MSIKNFTIHELAINLRHEVSEDLYSTREKHIARAAIRVLGTDIPSSKTYTVNQKIKIVHEIEKQEIEKKKKITKRQNKVQASLNMIEALRNDAKTIDTVNDPLALTSLLEDYYQIAGCKISYGQWKQGDRIPGPHPSLPNYIVHKIIKNKKGLQIICLTPEEKDERFPPIICCRGTTSSKHNWVDDMEESIGLYGLKGSEEAIKQTLQKIAADYGPVVMTGHSLGGAIAQILTSKFFDLSLDGNPSQSLIKSLYIFNSPGVGGIKQEYLSKQEHLRKKENLNFIFPTIHYYYHAADIVVLAGRGRLPATKKIKLGRVYSFLEFLCSPVKTIKQAHSWRHRISEFKKEGIFEIVSHMSSDIEKLIRGVCESFRRLISMIAHRILSYHIKQRILEKEKAENIRQMLFSQQNASLLYTDLV